MTIQEFVEQEYEQYLFFLFKLQQENKAFRIPVKAEEDGIVTVKPDFFENGEHISVHFHGFFYQPELRKEIARYHRHDYFEMIYVYKGSFHNRFSDTEDFTMQAGDILLLSPNIVHSVYTTSKEDIVFNILIARDFFEGAILSILKDNTLFSFFFTEALYKSEKIPRYLYFAYNHDPKIKGLCEMMILEYLNKEKAYQNMLHSSLMMLFALLSREHDRSAVAQFHQGNNLQVFKIINYIAENCAGITLDQLADHFHYSKGYISKLLSNETGRSFRDLVNEMRLAKAADRLITSDEPLPDILEAYGFMDQSYFYRLFKKQYGITPIQYRKRKPEKPRI